MYSRSSCLLHVGRKPKNCVVMFQECCTTLHYDDDVIKNINFCIATVQAVCCLLSTVGSGIVC